MLTNEESSEEQPARMFEANSNDMIRSEDQSASDSNVSNTTVPLPAGVCIHVLGEGSAKASPEDLMRIKIHPFMKFEPSKCFAKGTKRKSVDSTHSYSGSDYANMESRNSVPESEESFMNELQKSNFLKDPYQWLIQNKVVSKTFDMKTANLSDMQGILKGESKGIEGSERWLYLQRQIRPGFFANYEKYQLKILLALTFHWSFSSDLDDIKKDCDLPIDKLFELWLQFKKVCSDVLDTVGPTGRIAGKLVEVAVFKYGGHAIISVMDRNSHLTCSRVVPFKECANNIVSILDSLITPFSTIVTDCSLVDGLKITPRYVTVVQPNNYSMDNSNLKNYIRRHMHNMFERFAASTVDEEVLQLYFKELEWRERFAQNAKSSFWNILYSIAKTIGKPNVYKDKREERKLFCSNEHQYPLSACTLKFYELHANILVLPEDKFNSSSFKAKELLSKECQSEDSQSQSSAEISDEPDAKSSSRSTDPSGSLDALVELLSKKNGDEAFQDLADDVINTVSKNNDDPPASETDDEPDSCDEPSEIYFLIEENGEWSTFTK